MLTFAPANYRGEVDEETSLTYRNDAMDVAGKFVGVYILTIFFIGVTLHRGRQAWGRGLSLECTWLRIIR